MYFSSRQSQISLSDVAWIWEKFKRPAALNAQTFLKWNGNIDSIRSTEMVTFYCKRWMGATLHEKIYLIGFYSKYTTTNDVCTHIAGVSLFWFIKPTFVTSETENLYTLYTIDKKFKWVGSFVHFNWQWYLETDMCNSKIDEFRHDMAWNVMVGYSKINQNICFVCLINQYSHSYK